MPVHFKLYIVILCCIIPVTSICAQQDTITKTQKGFNALNYSLQKRYIPKGQEFKNNNFSDNLYIGIWGGIDKIVPRAGTKLSLGEQAGVSATKEFNAINGMRLSGYWKSFSCESDNMRLNGYGIAIDHIFNISAFLNGYDPHRFMEISTVEGLGGRISTLGDEVKGSFDLHLGLQLKINTNSRINIFIEPQIAILTDGADHSSQRNWHKYDVGYGGIIGINYRLGSYYKRDKTQLYTEYERFLANSFISIGGGVQFQNSALVRQIGILKSIGPNGYLSLGKWLVNPFGIRISGFISQNDWRYNEDIAQNEWCRYGGARIEAMLNPIAFFTKDKFVHWEVIPMFGVEFGKMNKQNGSDPIQKSYTAMTGGIQLKYYIKKNLAVFIEPHASHIPYSFIKKGEKTKSSYADDVFNLNIGIEFRTRK